MEVKICVGSSCHLRGSQEVVMLFQNAVEEYSLGDKIALMGSFCAEKCNRVGVTVDVDGEVHTGVTPDNFNEFFKDKVIAKLSKGV